MEPRLVTPPPAPLALGAAEQQASLPPKLRVNGGGLGIGGAVQRLDLGGGLEPLHAVAGQEAHGDRKVGDAHVVAMAGALEAERALELVAFRLPVKHSPHHNGAAPHMATPQPLASRSTPRCRGRVRPRSRRRGPGCIPAAAAGHTRPRAIATRYTCGLCAPPRRDNRRAQRVHSRF